MSYNTRETSEIRAKSTGPLLLRYSLKNLLEKSFKQLAAGSHQIVNVKKVLVHHFWPIGLARNLIEIFTFTPQATPCSIRLLAIHI